jgi:hypothetical protein
MCMRFVPALVADLTATSPEAVIRLANAATKHRQKAFALTDGRCKYCQSMPQPI